MLQIIDQTPSRVILQDRRPYTAFVAAVFTLISIVSLLLTLWQGAQAIILRAQSENIILRLLGLGVFTGLGALFIVGGVFITVNISRGITCILDKQTGTLSLVSMGFLRNQRIQHSLYGVAHLDVETNTETRAYGLFFVLRSGERIPLAAFAFIDHDHMETVVAQVRAFLRA